MVTVKYRALCALFLLAVLCALLWGCDSPADPPEDTPHDHAAAAWQTVTLPTCSAEGRQSQSCKQCKTKLLFANIAKTAHKPDSTGRACTVCKEPITYRKTRQNF